MSSPDTPSMFTFLVRSGYLVNPNLLVYILGGGVEGDFAIPADDNAFDLKENKWVLGYTVGAGVEYRINQNWSLRGECRYIGFTIDRDQSDTTTSNQDPEGPNNISNTTTSTVLTSDTDFHFNMGKIGVVYRI